MSCCRTLGVVLVCAVVVGGAAVAWLMLSPNPAAGVHVCRASGYDRPNVYCRQEARALDAQDWEGAMLCYATAHGGFPYTGARYDVSAGTGAPAETEIGGLSRASTNSCLSLAALFTRLGQAPLHGQSYTVAVASLPPGAGDRTAVVLGRATFSYR